MRGLHPLATSLAFLLSAMSVLPAAAARTAYPTPMGPEVPRDPYVKSPRETHATSPAYRVATDATFFSVQVNVNALGQNIVGDAANEPSLAVDSIDPNRMVIGWRQFNTISSDFRQAGYGFTTDGGQTWTFPGVIEPGVFRSDPVLGSDAQGTPYYNSLTVQGTSTYLCYVFRSSDGGSTWDSGVFAHGGDKQWMAIDKTGGVGNGHVYAYWTSFYSSCPPGFFTRSTDAGDTFENCRSIPQSPFWGTLAVGPAGELFVVGTDGGSGFIVGMSSNARNTGAPTTWDFSANFSLGGSITSGVGPNPGGLLGQTWIAVDPASASNVYVLCSVDPPGVDPLDVKFARSTDGGHTWSAPVRVNDDPGTSAWQWFGTMSVSPSGRIDAIWLDTRDNPGTYRSSLYYSYSTDHGVSWSANERLSTSFDPYLGWPQQQKMGDYFHMVSDDQGFRLAWAATFNGEQDVYFGRKTLAPVAVAETGVGPGGALQSDPNPFRLSTTVRYRVPQDAYVTLKVYDTLGRMVTTLVEREQKAGPHEVLLNGRGLASGVYFYHLTAGDYRQTQKVLLVK